MSGSYQAVEMRILSTLQDLRNGKGSLYDIATWCCELFNGQDDYAAEIGIKPEDIPDHINRSFLGEFAIDLGDCLTLLSYFPKREQWNRSLLDLLESAKSLIVSEVPQKATTRRRASVAELDAANARVASLEMQVERQAAEIAALRKENTTLRRENAKMKKSSQPRQDKEPSRRLRAASRA